MSTPRTSQSHPLQIAEVRPGPRFGRIGLTLCPGKYDPHAHTGPWNRDLATDLDAIAAWGARLVLTLLEPQEFRLLRVPHLGDEVLRRGLTWRHLPIGDHSVPDAEVEQRWPEHSAEMCALLKEGNDVLVHCKGGLGRAGMVAARLLVELGVDSRTAVLEVRRARRGAIETPSQLAWAKRGQAPTSLLAASGVPEPDHDRSTS